MASDEIVMSNASVGCRPERRMREAACFDLNDKASGIGHVCGLSQVAGLYWMAED
jgi:hypothetical protein